ETITDHYDIEWFKIGKALQAKKAKALKSTRVESSNANRSKTPTKSGCSRHMTGVKRYLHKHVEQPGPTVVFGDDSTCTTERYGSIKSKGGSSSIFTLFSLPAGAELTVEVKEFLLPLTGAKDGLFIMAHFKVLALNVNFDLKIDLIVFGLEAGSAPFNFFSGGI
nr:retrovirus-related Pol polyprotein from transposon TNT 1-94 [Tanacetum cinerariifolium]